MRISIFGRHQRHTFAEDRPTVAEIVERVTAEYAHLAGPDEYPTAALPVYVAKQIAARGQAAEPEVDGGRPLNELDYALVMGGAR